jgi:hypothetical protein
MSKAAENVSLWLNNEEGTYRMMVAFCRRNNRQRAAELMLEALKECGMTETPDGDKYTVSSIKYAMQGI